MRDLPSRNSTDPFKNSVHQNILRASKQLPGQLPSLSVSCSYDRYEDLFEFLDRLPNNYPLFVTLYDEQRSIDDKSYGNIQELIRVLNAKRIKKMELHMSDNAMPLYNLSMYRVRWNHQDKTKLYLSIDRHPLQEKRLNLTYATGEIMLPEEKLLWVPKHILRNLDDRINPRVFEETKKLRRFLDNYNRQIKQRYKYEELTDIEKTLIVYDDLKKSIHFAAERTTTYPETNITTIVRDEDNWQSRPYGTLEHKRGVCEGQARLMVCMLNNPEMMVDACTINGFVPSGTRHTWVGIHTNDKLYECCTTMQGPFRNLQNKGYKADIDDKYMNAYKRDFLTDKDFTEACAGVIRKRR